MTQCGTAAFKLQATQAYQARNPEASAPYKTIQSHFETWLALANSGQIEGQGEHYTPPRFVAQAVRKCLERGVFAHGFAKARSGDCNHDFLAAFSGKGRGVCPSPKQLVQAPS